MGNVRSRVSATIGITCLASAVGVHRKKRRLVLSVGRHELEGPVQPNRAGDRP